MTHPETDAVHGDTERDPSYGAVARPLVLSSTFDYPERADGAPSRYIYTRYANPTIEAVEAKVARLEATDDAVCFASGMAAISGALMSLLKSGDRILTTPHLYGGTDQLFDKGLHRFGIGVDTLPTETLVDPDRLGRAATERHRVLYVESPTNPMLRVLDVPALVSAAHDADLIVVVDNTFAGPCLMRPARLGADVVCESATKSMGGHSDLIAGVVAGSHAMMGPVRETRKIWGASLDPAAAYRLDRGLMTLPLRVRYAGETARRLAELLSQHDWLDVVHHPSLPDHPDHAVATRTLDGPVALVTFVMSGGEEAAVRLRRRVRLIRPAASLGGVETLLSLPSETSHAHLDVAQRSALGVPPGTVRLAVGLEHVDDLLADLDQAATT